VFAGRRSALIGVVVLGAAALTACSSSGSSTKTSDGSTHITVAYAANGAGFSDLYVGVDQGIFKKHGLDVTLKQITPATLVPGVVSGDIQFGGGVADGTASAILKGEKLKYVALTEGTYNLQLWVSSKIHTVDDLKGKSIALTNQGSETDFAISNYLQANNLADSAVDRKFLVNTPQMISSMKSGAVAAGLFQPPTAQAMAADGFHILSSLSNLPYAVGAYIAQSDYVTKHAAVVKNFLAAETESLAYLQGHPTQTMASIEKHSGDTSSSDAKIAYDFFIHVWKKDPTVTPTLIQGAFDRASSKAGKSAPSDISQYIYTPAS
jgi:NitT/TauT family transport system substrate-binding protein